MGNSQKISNWGTNFHSISLTWSCILFFETLDSKCCRICPTMALVKLPGITGFLLFWVITLIQKACKLERVKERDFHNTVLESHIYRQFLWYFWGEICVFDFHCCLQEVMEELQETVWFYMGNRCWVGYRSHKPQLQRIYSGCLLYILYRQPSVQG